MPAPQPTLFALDVATWDLEGVAPSEMTRDQLARAAQAFVSRGESCPPAARALLAAAGVRLAERTYRDAVELERCALCLQEIRR